jgi:leucyl aminopeptidase
VNVGSATSWVTPSVVSCNQVTQPDWSAPGVIVLGLTQSAAESTLANLEEMPQPTQVAADQLGLQLVTLAKALGATGAPGEVTWLSAPLTDSGCATLLLVGLGQGTLSELRQAAAAQARATRGHTHVVSWILESALPDNAAKDVVMAVVDGVTLGSFAYSLGRQKLTRLPARQVEFPHLGTMNQQWVNDAVAIAQASWRARELASVPANIKNPTWFAELAKQEFAGTGVSVKVWDVEELADAGMGGLIAVGQASQHPPCLIELSYRPPHHNSALNNPAPNSSAPNSSAPIVLVGKGITFDTGGLSLKQGEAMTTMKRDMSGAGVVFAVLAALEKMAATVPVTGLLCMAENSVSGNSMRPGDIITHYGGRTSEVNNTDAEGRLVLADALAYARDQLGPSIMIDIATLTGAVKVALGQRVGGMFANQDALAQALAHHGEAAGEQLWRLPLAAEYGSKLTSSVADTINAPAGPGAIMGALYLQHFVGDTPWAHLDLASVGDSPSDYHEWTEGQTGFGARLLLRWLTTEGSDKNLCVA